MGYGNSETESDDDGSDDDEDYDLDSVSLKPDFDLFDISLPKKVLSPCERSE